MEATTVSTRDRILYAAAELFRRQGYAGTGLKQVVAEAGAPFGSLYHHFPGGKQQLGVEVIEAAGPFFAAIATAAYEEGSTPAESVRAAFRHAADNVASTGYEDACPIAVIALEVASTDEVLRQATAAVFEGWTAGLTQMLGDRGKALAFLAALEGGFVLARASRSKEPLLAAGEMVAAFVAA